MITSLGTYKRELGKFIREEEEGIIAYAKLIKALPATTEFDSIRQSIRRIASDERDHVTILKRLLAHVS